MSNLKMWESWMDGVVSNPIAMAKMIKIFEENVRALNAKLPNASMIQSNNEETQS